MTTTLTTPLFEQSIAYAENNFINDNARHLHVDKEFIRQNFDLKGKKMEQITFDGMFDAFPMFSPDGKKLIFSSNRNNNGTHDTNLFIADWKD